VELDGAPQGAHAAVYFRIGQTLGEQRGDLSLGVRPYNWLLAIARLTYLLSVALFRWRV
jgi:hypothetical protein